MIRALIYWSLSSAVAVAAARASAETHEMIGFAYGSGQIAPGLPVTETARSVLLAVGIMAVAFTYRRAWLNLTVRQR